MGRVFTSGKPEMTHNVQQYDKTCFLRVDEAQRCRVHSALFMPLYTSTAHRHPIGVFEVVQANTDVLFPVLVQWLKCCLQVGLRNPSNYHPSICLSPCRPCSAISLPRSVSRQVSLPSADLQISAELPSFALTHILLFRKCSCTQLILIRMP